MSISFYVEPIYYYLVSFCNYLVNYIFYTDINLNLKNEDMFNKKDTAYDIELSQDEHDDLIPKILYMCCKDKNIIPNYVIDNWARLNPEYKICIYDDSECIDFLKKNFDNRYVDIFNFIKDGPIKSDFWRVCILYAYGGVYSDIDIEPISRLNTILHKKISFLTVKRNMDYMFNPHFIASVKNNIILKEIIDKYIFYYENNFTYKYWKWSILNISQPIINKYIGYNIQEGVYKYNDVYCKIITENISFKNLLLNRYKAYNSYNNTVLFNTRYLTYDELNHTY